MSNDFKCITVRDDEWEKFSDALADVNCWMNGFTQGGGEYSPLTINVLRDLQLVIRRAYDTIPPKTSLPERRTLLFDPPAGWTIEGSVTEAMRIAKASTFVVTVRFNDRIFSVTKGQTRKQVFESFDHASKFKGEGLV